MKDTSKYFIIKIVTIVVIVFILFMTYIFYNYFLKYKKESFSNNVNPSDTNKTDKEDSHINHNTNDTNNTNDLEPEPNLASSNIMTSNQKLNTNQLVKTDINHSESDPNSFFKDWSPYAKKWPCTMNVTGTFTECGPNAYNSCGCNKF